MPKVIKRRKTSSKGVALKLLLAAGAIALVFYGGKTLRHDLDPKNMAVKIVKHDWEFNDLSTTRTMGKDVWDISAEKVVRALPQEKMKNVNAVITGPSGKRTVKAPSGLYNDREKTLYLEKPDGTWDREQNPIVWEAGSAFWNQKDDTWHFDNGVNIKSDAYSLKGEKAVMTGQTQFHVENGVIGWWSK